MSYLIDIMVLKFRLIHKVPDDAVFDINITTNNQLLDSFWIQNRLLGN